MQNQVQLVKIGSAGNVNCIAQGATAQGDKVLYALISLSGVNKGLLTSIIAGKQDNDTS